VFPALSHFYVSITFPGKDRACPSGFLAGLYSKSLGLSSMFVTLSPKSNIGKQDWEPARDSTGLVLVLPTNIRLGWKINVCDKLSNLLQLGINYDRKKIYETGPKLFEFISPSSAEHFYIFMSLVMANDIDNLQL